MLTQTQDIKTALIMLCDSCENYGVSLCSDGADSQKRKDAVRILSERYAKFVSILAGKGVWPEC